jgi:hypothetical protein
VGRQLRRVVAETSHVDNLRDVRTFSLLGDGRGRAFVDLVEVGRAQRVHEVVDDVDAVERAPHRRRVGRVGCDRSDAVGFGSVARPRHGDDLGPLRELRYQGTTDEPRRAEHSRSHDCASSISRLK